MYIVALVMNGNHKIDPFVCSPAVFASFNERSDKPLLSKLGSASPEIARVNIYMIQELIAVRDLPWTSGRRCCKRNGLIWKMYTQVRPYEEKAF